MLLNVYELEPEPLEKNNSQSTIEQTEMKNVLEEEQTDNPNLEQIPQQKTKSSFIAMCQRKPDLMPRPFLHNWTQRVFGNPLLLRVIDLEGYTGSDLYDLVAKRIQLHVPPGALPYLMPIETRNSAYSQEHANGSGMRRRRPECNKTNAYSEESAFGEIPRYGFRLRITSRDGQKCSVCPWYDSCIGSLIPDDDYPTIVADGDTVSVDWHIAVDLTTDSFGKLLPHDGKTNLGAKILSNVKRHHSCFHGKKKCAKGSITLEECLEAFSMEEKIPEVCNNMYITRRKILIPQNSAKI